MTDKPRYRARFQSIADPNEHYPLDEVVYRSRTGDLLEVVHDLRELQKTSPEAWKRRFK